MKKILYPLLALLILFSSCSEDSVYRLPEGEILVEEYYANPANIDPGLASLYYNFRFMQAFDLLWGDMGTDDALKGGGGADDAGESAILKENYSYNAASDFPKTVWSECYNGIANVHEIMETINTYTSGNTRDSIYAEAMFLRGYFYYNLAKYFGDVPIVLLGDSVGGKPKRPEEEVWDQAISDLDSAALFLPQRQFAKSGRVGRADKGAAIGLACKASSYRKDMEGVKKYAEELFALNEYSLAPDYAHIFQPRGEWNSGSIWELEYYTSPLNSDWGARDRKGSYINIILGTRIDAGGTIPARAGSNQNGWGFHLPTKSLYDEFEEGDPRKSCTMFTVPDSLAQNYVPAVDRNVDDTLKYAKNGWFNRKYSNTPWTDYIFVKGAQPDNQDHNLRLVRLADIYLLYAEAIYESDPTTAQHYVNLVRERARNSSSWKTDEITRKPAQPSVDLLPDVTATGEALLQAIYHERRVELAMEFDRYWDLIRTDREDIIQAAAPGYNSPKNRYMPIPAEEIQRYPDILIQRPGY